MSRKMDAHIHTIDDLRRRNGELTKMRRELRNAESEKSAIEAQLLKTMGKSTIGTVNGQVVISIGDTERRSVSVSTVEKVCPELKDKLVVVHEGKKVKVLDV